MDLTGSFADDMMQVSKYQQQQQQQKVDTQSQHYQFDQKEQERERIQLYFPGKQPGGKVVEKTVTSGTGPAAVVVKKSPAKALTKIVSLSKFVLTPQKIVLQKPKKKEESESSCSSTSGFEFLMDSRSTLQAIITERIIDVSTFPTETRPTRCFSDHMQSLGLKQGQRYIENGSSKKNSPDARTSHVFPLLNSSSPHKIRSMRNILPFKLEPVTNSSQSFLPLDDSSTNPPASFADSNRSPTTQFNIQPEQDNNNKKSKNNEDSESMEKERSKSGSRLLSDRFWKTQENKLENNVQRILLKTLPPIKKSVVEQGECVTPSYEEYYTREQRKNAVNQTGRSVSSHSSKSPTGSIRSQQQQLSLEKLKKQRLIYSKTSKSEKKERSSNKRDKSKERSTSRDIVWQSAKEIAQKQALESSKEASKLAMIASSQHSIKPMYEQTLKQKYAKATTNWQSSQETVNIERIEICMRIEFEIDELKQELLENFSQEWTLIEIIEEFSMIPKEEFINEAVRFTRHVIESFRRVDPKANSAASAAKVISKERTTMRFQIMPKSIVDWLIEEVDGFMRYCDIPCDEFMSHFIEIAIEELLPKNLFEELGSAKGIVNFARAVLEKMNLQLDIPEEMLSANSPMLADLCASTIHPIIQNDFSQIEAKLAEMSVTLTSVEFYIMKNSVIDIFSSFAMKPTADLSDAPSTQRSSLKSNFQVSQVFDTHRQSKRFTTNYQDLNLRKKRSSNAAMLNAAAARKRESLLAFEQSETNSFSSFSKNDLSKRGSLDYLPTTNPFINKFQSKINEIQSRQSFAISTKRGSMEVSNPAAFFAQRVSEFNKRPSPNGSVSPERMNHVIPEEFSSFPVNNNNNNNNLQLNLMTSSNNRRSIFAQRSSISKGILSNNMLDQLSRRQSNIKLPNNSNNRRVSKEISFPDLIKHNSSEKGAPQQLQTIIDEQYSYSNTPLAASSALAIPPLGLMAPPQLSISPKRQSKFFNNLLRDSKDRRPTTTIAMFLVDTNNSGQTSPTRRGKQQANPYAMQGSLNKNSQYYDSGDRRNLAFDNSPSSRSPRRRQQNQQILQQMKEESNNKKKRRLFSSSSDGQVNEFTRNQILQRIEVTRGMLLERSKSISQYLVVSQIASILLSQRDFLKTRLVSHRTSKYVEIFLVELSTALFLTKEKRQAFIAAQQQNNAEPFDRSFWRIVEKAYCDVMGTPENMYMSSAAFVIDLKLRFYYIEIDGLLVQNDYFSLSAENVVKFIERVFVWIEDAHDAGDTRVPSALLAVFDRRFMTIFLQEALIYGVYSALDTAYALKCFKVQADVLDFWLIAVEEVLLEGKFYQAETTQELKAFAKFIRDLVPFENIIEETK